MNKESYTAASTFPSKLLHQKVIENGRILPIHLQISPTNACNLNCGFCSCRDRDKKKQLSLEQVIKILDICAERGTKAITWTGGGEPLMNPDINEMLNYASELGIKSGLVTNGILLKKLDYHDNLTWCRVSSSDDRIPAFDSIREAIKINPRTDWAFSHVISRNPNYQTIKSLIDFAESGVFTHIRLVSDLCDLDNVPSMKEVKKSLGKIDDSKVIYQGRKDSTCGEKDCYVSLLKPVIAPEGIFPCCGFQYHRKNMKHDLIEEEKWGGINDLMEIIDNQINYDGKNCEICYYSEYNSALKKLKNKPEHMEFV